MVLRPISAALAVLFLGTAAAVSAAQVSDVENSELFETLSPTLFVVEAFEQVSQSKNSVGSGFAVADGTLIATNYHVISSAFLNPEQYSLRSKDVDGNTIDLEVVAADPINDLALLQARSVPAEGAAPLAAFGIAIAESEPAVGEAVVSLGNPLDVGLSVVPGTYNGLLRSEFRPHIHFTGALNPGMSGGPAVNDDGELIGINVAGAGNSVSFLVPAARLAELLSALPEAPQPVEVQRERFAGLVRDHQDSLIEDLLAGDWSLQEFGPLLIPKEVREYVNCQGAAKEQDADARWEHSISNCVVRDRMFLDRRFDTGTLEMFFAIYESENLSAFPFARMFGSSRFFPANRGGEDELTDFECVDRWTTLPQLEDQAFKAAYCLRSYLDYPGIYDVLYVARAMRDNDQGIHIHYTLAGVGRDSAEAFHRQFLGAVQWK